MKKHGRDRRPYVKPVTRIELSEKNIRLRWILIVVLLSIAVVSIATGLLSLLNVQPGWNAVEVSSDQPNYGTEFTLMYDFSEAGGNATAVNKNLIALYSDAAEDAYRLFSPDASEEGLYNINYLNSHVNEAVTVEETLYNAFTMLEKYGNRCLYLAPVYMEYDRIFRSESDVEAARFDPEKNPEIMAYIQELAAFAADSEMIRLELLGDCKVKLLVSDAYLSYAEENGIEEYIDFGWMKNAFIADFIAERLAEQGYTQGYLASYDGFTRNLDALEDEFTFNIFDMENHEVFMPARLRYSGPMSIVFLRSYPLDELDRWHYYLYENGEIATTLIDPADGVSKGAISNLVSYSDDFGCAQLLVRMIPVFVTEEFSEEAVKAMAEEDIYSIWSQNGELRYNDSGAVLELLADNTGSFYTKSYVGK